MELSGAPLINIHQTCAEVNKHLGEVRTVAAELGQSYLGIGYTPNWGLEDAPQMPKGRYRLMTDYMPTRGTRGLEMMYLTATVQVNLISSPADMVEKLKIALALQPWRRPCSPIRRSKWAYGEFVGTLARLSDTDPDRTGMLPMVFEPGFGFEHYVDYALDAPMYFVQRDGEFINALGMSFLDFWKDACRLAGEKPTEADWEDHLTTLFPKLA